MRRDDHRIPRKIRFRPKIITRHMPSHQRPQPKGMLARAAARICNTYTRGGAGEHALWLGALMRRHVPCDYLWPESDFAGYAMIIAPHLKIMTTELVKKLGDYVRGGGRLL